MGVPNTPEPVVPSQSESADNTVQPTTAQPSINPFEHTTQPVAAPDPAPTVVPAPEQPTVVPAPEPMPSVIETPEPPKISTMETPAPQVSAMNTPEPAIPIAPYGEPAESHMDEHPLDAGLPPMQDPEPSVPPTIKLTPEMRAQVDTIKAEVAQKTEPEVTPATSVAQEQTQPAGFPKPEPYSGMQLPTDPLSHDNLNHYMSAPEANPQGSTFFNNTQTQQVPEQPAQSAPAPMPQPIVEKPAKASKSLKDKLMFWKK